MLEDGDLQRIRDAVEGCEPPVVLCLHLPHAGMASATTLPDQTVDLFERLQHLVVDGTGGAVRGRRVLAPNDSDNAQSPDPAMRPSMTLERGDRRNICYLALPEGLETAPFVESLIALGSAEPAARPSWSGALVELDEEIELWVFVSPSCPHCPEAVRAALALANVSRRARVSIIDVHRYPTLAERFAVRSVPLTVINRDLALTGVVPAARLAEKIAGRHREAYAREAFLGLIEGGRFAEAVVHMQTTTGAASFVALWRMSTTTLRMGLMLAAGEALDRDRAALDDVAPLLLPILQTDDVPLQGDTADLLGQIGHACAIEALRPLTQHPHPDLAEIATDAIDEINDR